MGVVAYGQNFRQQSGRSCCHSAFVHRLTNRTAIDLIISRMSDLKGAGKRKRKERNRSQAVPDPAGDDSESLPHDAGNSIELSLKAIVLDAPTPSLTSDSPSTEPVPILAATNSVTSRSRRSRNATSSVSERPSDASAQTEPRTLQGWNLEIYKAFYQPDADRPIRCAITNYGVSHNAHILAYGFKDLRNKKVRQFYQQYFTFFPIIRISDARMDGARASTKYNRAWGIL